MKILVTGSDGLIGYECCKYFIAQGHEVFGLDNGDRHKFFRVENVNVDMYWQDMVGSGRYDEESIDLKDQVDVDIFFRLNGPFDAVIHAAAQPSHDLAAKIPLYDFDTNARATLILLECVRAYCPEAVFVYLSTNKVYGDRPNYLMFKEGQFRYDFKESSGYYQVGIGERFSVDYSKHSLFGCSKLSADLYTQEYGKYFGIRTVCLRGGCLTGKSHRGAEAHGFLSYLCKCALDRKRYTIYGYNGKQVRDNIHAYDVATAIECVLNDPPEQGEVYNIGGGYRNSVSILEAMHKIEELTGVPVKCNYENQARSGDHICYYTDMSAFCSRYPEWKITYSLDKIFMEHLGI